MLTAPGHLCLPYHVCTPIKPALERSRDKRSGWGKRPLSIVCGGLVPFDKAKLKCLRDFVRRDDAPTPCVPAARFARTEVSIAFGDGARATREAAV